LHIKGRPVNPVTAKIPLLASIPENKRQAFDAQCTTVISLMERPLQLTAKSDTPAEATF
jgi:murein DD-endopeptidase